MTPQRAIKQMEWQDLCKMVQHLMWERYSGNRFNPVIDRTRGEYMTRHYKLATWGMTSREIGEM